MSQSCRTASSLGLFQSLFRFFEISFKFPAFLNFFFEFVADGTEADKPSTGGFKLFTRGAFSLQFPLRGFKVCFLLAKPLFHIMQNFDQHA